MYKSKLQILCQRNSWELPAFSTTKVGFDHCPSFTATVTVNGVPFTTPDQSRTSKDAQNKAAKLAFDHFSTPAPNRNPNPNPNPNFPQPLLMRPASTSSASITDMDVSPLIGGITQQTAIETRRTPVMNETPFGVKDDKKSVDMDVRPPIGGITQQTSIETRRTPVMNGTPSGVEDDKKFKDIRHMYKNRLQNYAQKRNLSLPEYSSEREGPAHASRFRSKVLFDGKTYGSPEFFPTIKEAEIAAAKVAWESLSVNEVQEDDSGIYKNLLQELAQKEGLHVPTYETIVSGPPHNPTFVSTVEIGGQYFEGQAAKSKKQAETNAAKIAYAGHHEHKDRVTLGKTSLISATLPSGSQIKKALEVSSSILQSVITGDLQHSTQPNANKIHKPQHKDYLEDTFNGGLQQSSGRKANLIHEERDTKYIAGNEEKKSSNLIPANAQVNTRHATAPPPEADINAKRHRFSTSADFMYASLRDPFPSASSSSSSPEAGFSSSSVRSECSTDTTTDSFYEKPAGAGETNGSRQGKILVYPRVPNMTFPDGATVLPFSDDKWVALKM